MTDKLKPDGGVIVEDEGKLLHRSNSPTAATRGRRLYKASGAMVYRVKLATAIGMVDFDVEARTGDEAAGKALQKHPGCKVAYVGPIEPWNDPVDVEYFDAEAA